MSNGLGDSLLVDDEDAFTSNTFGLDERLLKAIQKMGFKKPTIVQVKSIPLALEGKDLLIQARTGSGKTVSYGIPLIQKVLYRPPSEELSITGLILAPSSELVSQIYHVFQSLTYYCDDVVTLLAVTGENEEVESARLRERPTFVISTPSRLLRLLERSTFILARVFLRFPDKMELKKEKVSTVVIDEADLIYSFGHKQDMEKLTQLLPPNCQSFLISATLSDEVEIMRKLLLHNPVVLKLKEDHMHQLEQFFIPVKDDNRYLLIYGLLKLGILTGKILFFVNSIDTAYKLKLFLDSFSIRSAVLNSELPLNSRLNMLDQFNRDKYNVLIATDEGITQKMTALIEEKSNWSSDGEEEEGGELEGEEDVHEEALPDSDDAESSSGSENEEADEKEKPQKSQKRKRSSEMEKSFEVDDEEGEGEEGEDEEDGENDLSHFDQPEDGETESDDEAVKESSDTDSSDGEQKSFSKKDEAPETSDYGVTRGFDFRAVSIVINFDFPPSASSYFHRIGRTARATLKGTSITLHDPAIPAEKDLLMSIQVSQPQKNDLPQPQPFNFQQEEINLFRYRVNDVLGSITKHSIREARIQEIKQQMLNSEKLKIYFDENPNVLKLLKHDKPLVKKIRPGLRTIPFYLVPPSMQHASDQARKSSSKERRRVYGSKKQDPLKNFSVGVDALKEATEARATVPPQRRLLCFSSSQPFKAAKGHNLSGRNLWKMKHKKGQWSSGRRNKRRKTNP